MMRVVFMFFILLCGWGVGAQDALDYAIRQTEQQRHAESAAWLDTYIAEHPQRKYDVGRAWWLKSYNLLQLGQYDEALAANDQSIRLRQQLRTMDIAENYLRRAQIYLAMNQASDALVAAQQGMDMLIEDPALYADLNVIAAQVLIRMGDYSEANEYLKIATDVLAVEVGTSDPVYGAVSYKAGCALTVEQDHAAAFAAFATAYHALQDPVQRMRALLNARRAYSLMIAQKMK